MLEIINLLGMASYQTVAHDPFMSYNENWVSGIWKLLDFYKNLDNYPRGFKTYVGIGVIAFFAKGFTGKAPLLEALSLGFSLDLWLLTSYKIWSQVMHLSLFLYLKIWDKTAYPTYLTNDVQKKMWKHSEKYQCYRDCFNDVSSVM